MRSLVIAGLLALLAAVPSAAAPPIPVLWSVSADGGHRVAIRTLPTDGRIIDRTDAGRLAVVTDDGLVLEDADGANRVLLPDTTYLIGASFSPDGSSILFTRRSADGSWSPDPATWQLAVATADGSAVRVVARDAGYGSWSRDGRTIVYLGSVVRTSAAVRAVAARGGKPRTLAAGAYPGDAPELSPDGKSVAYVCRNAAGGTLCVTRGGRTHRYAHAGWSPLWSPNGRWIATNVLGNYLSGTALVDTVKGTRTVISMPSLIGTDDVPLAWSPDSTRLVYQRECAAGTSVPRPCRIAAWLRTVATRRVRRMSVDGLSWSLVHWHGGTITYVTR